MPTSLHNWQFWENRCLESTNLYVALVFCDLQQNKTLLLLSRIINRIVFGFRSCPLQPTLNKLSNAEVRKWAQNLATPRQSRDCAGGRQARVAQTSAKIARVPQRDSCSDMESHDYTDELLYYVFSLKLWQCSVLCLKLCVLCCLIFVVMVQFLCKT